MITRSLLIRFTIILSKIKGLLEVYFLPLHHYESYQVAIRNIDVCYHQNLSTPLLQ